MYLYIYVLHIYVTQCLLHIREPRREVCHIYVDYMLKSLYEVCVCIKVYDLMYIFISLNTQTSSSVQESACDWQTATTEMLQSYFANFDSGWSDLLARCRSSRKLILFIVFVALFLDNMLLTTVGKLRLSRRPHLASSGLVAHQAAMHCLQFALSLATCLTSLHDFHNSSWSYLFYSFSSGIPSQSRWRCPRATHFPFVFWCPCYNPSSSGSLLSLLERIWCSSIFWLVCLSSLIWF